MTSYAEAGRRTGRLWQILHFPLVRIFLASLALIASIGGVQSVLSEPLRAAPTLSSLESLGWLAIYLAGSVLVAIGCYRVYVRIVEQRRPDELSGRAAVRALSAGSLIGGALFATTLGVL